MINATAALTKPTRVLHELTATEQFIRATERAKEIRDAARARLDADFVERIEDARSRYLAPRGDETPVPVPVAG
jgi:hypothetical protein